MILAVYFFCVFRARITPENADPQKSEQLDWRKRYQIIEGIARGLLYLHEESRIKIIHRDLKTSNILLDENMLPKISDFGLAKLFDLDKSRTTSSRIVGTNGYIAPECLMSGSVSAKSDIFSYGIIVLEILTGRSISDFHGSGSAPNLTSFVRNEPKLNK
ncbi:cysteine-rich receptor-like protein kinase 10 [Carex littledalei]|uniref:non-specific serine/threonine protein kinase n=1 Tax=Carex littledalei TaxID=544730 RepID=A0A833QGN7_9POAL|nr:cysteine-rich receptor-like protein kinase 10 [Carex littledalei]